MMSWIDNRFKMWSFDNKDNYIVSETVVDANNVVHHKRLFEHISKEEAKKIVELLNEVDKKEKQIVDKNKRFTYSLDSFNEYKIFDDGKLLVEEIPHKSNAEVIVNKLNKLCDENDKLVKENHSLQFNMNFIQSQMNRYCDIKENRISDLEIENHNLKERNSELIWKMSLMEK